MSSKMLGVNNDRTLVRVRIDRYSLRSSDGKIRRVQSKRVQLEVSE